MYHAMHLSFNRTFMELKPRNTSCNVVDALQALIGPLWN